MIPDNLSNLGGTLYRVVRNGLLGLIGVFVGFTVWWSFTFFNNACKPAFAECDTGSGQLTIAAIGVWIVALSIAWFWVLPPIRSVYRRMRNRG